MTGRFNIDAETKRQILVESGYRCAVCGESCPIEKAHIVPYHKSKDDSPENLICLCPNCHERADRENWGEMTLREYKRCPWVMRRYVDGGDLPGKIARLQLTIDMDLPSFDERQRNLLRHGLANFLCIPAELVRIVRVDDGSIKACVELPEAEASLLSIAFSNRDQHLMESLGQLFPLKLSVVQHKSQATHLPQHRPQLSCFLSLPHEFSDLRQAIQEALASMPDVSIRSLYVTRSRGAQLRDEVTETLNRSDFIIADVSSGAKLASSPRPNILWELGYAWSMGLERIIVVNEQEPANVSSLIIDQHYIPYDPQRKDSLLPPLIEAVRAVCGRIRARREIERRIPKHSVYSDRAEVDLPRRIKEARHSIRILETNLQYVCTELGQHIVSALNDSTRLELTAQLCALDPDSAFVAARAEQLGMLESAYRSDLRKALDSTYRLLRDCDPALWNLRVYATFPTQIAFLIDDTVISAVVTLGRRSRDAIHFEVAATDRNAYDTFIAHFHQLYVMALTYEDWVRKPSRDQSAQLNP